ncbi:MAG: DUF4388 domain-containing protein, partial [Acidobacteriota bacterium]|nr:DUF4388 domain-containing protein [Acidobacteriota bacterium]
MALSDRSSGLTNGRLEGTSVPDLLWRLCRGRSTGVLHITAGDRTKSVYIDEGRIIFAASNDPDDRLGEMFFRLSLITLDQLEHAVTQLGSGRRLGTILVENGAIGPQDLVQGVMDQVQGIIMSMFLLEEGEYYFEEGPLPSDEVITLSMKTAELLLQGIRKVRSFSRIRTSVGQPRVAYRLTTGWESMVEGLELREGERALLGRLDHNGRTIEELCREVFLSNFEVYQALWAFKVLGVIEEADWLFEGVGSASIEGQLGPEGLAPILVRLCREGETGVLHATRGTLERTFQIRDGRCVFATSSNIDDGLVAHLLRRGVISLRDREETAKRLLSNKRVGTILREIGVIDEADLEIVVREQLSEIVFDTLRWDRGEYAFVAGELPTIEEITLDRSPEDLMLAGARRVSSWTRIEGGCGGLETPLVLSREHEDILDEMTVGPEEWEIVTAMRVPATLREICRATDLPDFLTCQLVWALKLLGIVVDADPMSASTACDRDDDEMPVETAAAVEVAPEPSGTAQEKFDDGPSEISEPYGVEVQPQPCEEEDEDAPEPDPM